MPQLRLHKPKVILFDVTGTTANTTFVTRILIGYLRLSVKAFVCNNWMHGQVQRDIAMLRKAAAANPNWPQVAPPTSPPEVVQASIEKLVFFCLDNNIDFMAFAQLRFHIWFDGYDKGLLVTPIYSDVAIQMKKWRCDEDIKLYVVSNGWAEANKVFMSRTNQGDMTLLIDGYFDSSLGPFNDPNTYRQVMQQVQTNPHEAVLLTKSGPSALAAASVGLLPILVVTHKKDHDQLSAEEKKIAMVRTLNEVEFEEYSN